MKQVILITGASSGIGKATALKLIEQGHFVYGAARRIDKMEDLEKAGGHAVQLDVTDHPSAANVVNQIVEEHGRINVLFNNAGYALYGAVEDVDIDEARREFEVNLFGLAAITKAVLPTMRNQKSGKIINTSSMGGKIYTPLGAWYHAAKHALEGWSDSLRLEVKPYGIHVVVIEPGLINTEFGEVMMEPLLERSANGPYEEIANAVAKTTSETYTKGNSSPPTVVADLVAKIVHTKNPKTRYANGKLAKPMIWLRKYLGDRMFDRIVMSQV